MGLFAGLLFFAVGVLFLGPGCLGVAPGTLIGFETYDSANNGLGYPTDERFFGQGIAAVGDVDGDGVDDIVVGQSKEPHEGFVVVFLNLDGTAREYVEVLLDAGWPVDTSYSNSAALTGDFVGDSLAAPGDMDGDGVPDLLISGRTGPTSDSQGGVVWLIFLNSDGTARSGVTYSVLDPLLSSHIATGDEFGRGLAVVGDLDGNGVVDIAVGAPNDDDDYTDSGAIYILFLGVAGVLEAVSKITRGSAGLSTGDTGLLHFGIGMGGAGDLDGDGVPDLVATFNDIPESPPIGVAWLFLNPNGSVHTVESTSDPFNGCYVTGDGYGSNVVVLGDITNNGWVDLAISIENFYDDGLMLIHMFSSWTAYTEEYMTINIGGKCPAGLDVIRNFNNSGLPMIVGGAPTHSAAYTNAGAFYLISINVVSCDGVDNSGAYRDECGRCVGGTTGLSPHRMDCMGVCNGTAELVIGCSPPREVCVGGTSPTFIDCRGDCNGTAFYDGDGNCTDVCLDGVAAPTEVCDPSAPDAPACCSSTCGVAAAGVLCRPANSSCDAAEYCDGVHVDCPADDALGSDVVCRPAVHACDLEERCPRALPRRAEAFFCPPDALAPSGYLCDDGDNCTGPVDQCDGAGACVPGTDDVCQPCSDGFRDDCLVCSGGSTAHVPNSDKDRCGVCFGNNYYEDECGQCMPTASSLDACGVCFGDNTTCVGCDGQPYSGLVYDQCGICNGDNSTCLGCDGIPVFLGGKHFDSCGICGGNSNGTCSFGCDGVEGSGLFYDCHGQCNGTSAVDDCGVCSGRPEIPANFHKDDVGVCFGLSQTCAGNFDDCQVCEGDNTTCMGCDHVVKSGRVVDACGVCGGTTNRSEDCHFGCDGVSFSGKSFDCAGLCGGASVIDDCGVCSGVLIPFNFHKDECGVCFGGNKQRDSCGVCMGYGKARDSCGRCFANNTNLDDCGVCFGGNRSKDLCGECFGNNTLCIGCDGLPNSGRVMDECGVCGGSNGCIANVQGIDRSALAWGVGIGLFLCVGCVAALAFVRARRAAASRTHILEYNKQIEEHATADAPAGHVTLACCDVVEEAVLWEAFPSDMPVAVEIYHYACRRMLEETGGYEVKMEGCQCVAAFQKSKNAISWASKVQLELSRRKWPKRMMSHPSMKEKRYRGTTIHRGFAVRMALHAGMAEMAFNERSQRIYYRGPVPAVVFAMLDVAHGGQILVSGEALTAAGKHVLKAEQRGKLVYRLLGSMPIRNVHIPPIDVYQVMPALLAMRRFPTFNGGGGGLGANALALDDGMSFDEDMSRDEDTESSDGGFKTKDVRLRRVGPPSNVSPLDASAGRSSNLSLSESYPSPVSSSVTQTSSNEHRRPLVNHKSEPVLIPQDPPKGMRIHRSALVLPPLTNKANLEPGTSPLDIRRKSLSEVRILHHSASETANLEAALDIVTGEQKSSSFRRERSRSFKKN